MAENFQDNVVFGGSTLGVSGNAISLGTAGGAKSIIFNNSDTVGHLAWNPTAARTINLPDAGGTILLASQGILSLSGGTTRITSGEVVFSNSNNVSWTVNGQTINASASQSVQTQGITGDQLSLGVSTGGNTAGNTTIQTGQRLVFIGSNMISISQATGAGSTTLQFSATQSIQTQGITGDQLSIGVSTGGNTAGNTTIQTGNRFVLVGTSGISLSQATGAGSTTISIIGNVVSNAIQSVGSATGSGTNLTRFAADDHVHAGVFSVGVSTGGNTIGDTSVGVGRFVFAGGNNITLSQATAAGGLNTITISAGAGGGETRMTAYATSNTTQSSTGTIAFSSYIFAGAGAASVGISNGSVVISAPNAGAGNVTFSAGTSSGGFASIVFSDSNNISFGLNGSTITGSVIPDSVGISTFGNTAGTTGLPTQRYVLVGSNGITLSQSVDGAVLSGTLTIQGWPFQSYFAVSNNGGFLTGASALTQTSGSSIFIQPFILPYPISVEFARFMMSFNDSAVGTAGTTSAATSFSVARYTTFGLGIYTMGVGASSQSLQTISTTSVGLTGVTIYTAGAQGSQYTITVQKTFPQSGFSTNVYTSSYAVSSGSIVISSNSNTLFTGQRFLDIPLAISLAPGAYWMGIGASTSSASNSSNISFAGTDAMALSLGAVGQSNISWGALGLATGASNNQALLGLGIWTTNASGFTKDSIGLSSISKNASNPHVPFQFIRQA